MIVIGDRAISYEAPRDGISPGWGRFLTWAPIVGLVGLVAAYPVTPRLYYWFLIEDHPVEWAQFGVLVATVPIAAWAAVEFGRRRRVGLAALLMLLALGTLVLAAEEISWGERVFGLVTPENLATLNKQQELNVHNLKVDGVSLNKISDLLKILLGILGATAALLTRTRRVPLRLRLLDDIAPPAAAIPGFAVMALYGAFMAVAQTKIAPLGILQEWAELSLYLAIAATAVDCGARVAVGRRTAPGLIAAGALAIVLTVVFAVLTVRSGVLPGNVPPSLTDLYLGWP
jgi:hypothetical protein